MDYEKFAQIVANLRPATPDEIDRFGLGEPSFVGQVEGELWSLSEYSPGGGPGIPVLSKVGPDGGATDAGLALAFEPIEF